MTDTNKTKLPTGAESRAIAEEAIRYSKGNYRDRPSFLKPVVVKPPTPSEKKEIFEILWHRRTC